MAHPEKIIDSHHHLWNPLSEEPNVGYVWLKNIGALKPFGDPTPIQRDYLLEEFSRETKVPLVGSIHVQADGAIFDPVAETSFICSISEEYNFPISVVGFVDLTQQNAETVITRHTAYNSVVGTRQILSRLDDNAALSFAPEHYLNNPTWRENFALLNEHNLSFDAQLYPEQMIDAAEFFAKHSNIEVIIDHAGSPYDPSENGFENWKSGMNALAQLGNVSAKISGLGMFNLHKQGSRNSVPYIETILDLFGQKRTLFGSNFPVDKLMTTYDDCLDEIIKCFPSDKTGNEWIKSIFHDNAKRIYKQ